MEYADIVWRDGQPYSDMFDDIYYSSNQGESISGESEFRHVFFSNNGLPGRWKGEDSRFVIAELGFGFGLNCILTIREWLKHLADCRQAKRLHYIAIEKYPLSPATIMELVSRYPELKQYYDELIHSYPPAIEGMHSRYLFDNRVVIHYRFMDVVDSLKDEALDVDAWFLDGFSPARNPGIWSDRVFSLIAGNSHHGTTCSTYTCAGFVKRNMQAAGFSVNKVSGFGSKRENLVGKFAGSKPVPLKYRDRPWYEPPLKIETTEKKVTIIGAGIAGLSLAYVLVKRGWNITLIDRHGDVAKETSSNPAPVLYPRLSINNDIDTEFFTAAYLYALHVLDTLQQKSRQRFWFGDGLLQLMDAGRITRIIDKYQFNNEYVAITDDENNGQAVVAFPSAGVVSPAVLCGVLRDECAERLHIIDAEVTSVKKDGDKWLCRSGTGLVSQSGILVVANGTAINRLDLPVQFPVEAIRGQVIELNANPASQQIRQTVNAAVHVTPAINGKHYLGASYTTNSNSLEIDTDESRQLLATLNEYYPGMFSQQDYSGSWLGFRTMSKDRVPIVGAVHDENFYSREYADICHGKVNREYQGARHLGGLYISAAHGSRGFTSSFLCAQIIAALIEGEPAPVSKSVLDYLNPSRFTVNELKRR